MKAGLIAVGVLVAFAFAAAAVRSFEAVPLESVSETTANAGIGDVNGDGHLDIVLAKGVAEKLFGQPLPMVAAQYVAVNA